MILAFKTFWGKEMGTLSGTATYFEEKIWTGLIPAMEEEEYLKKYRSYCLDSLERLGVLSPVNDDAMTVPKVHTIRRDSNMRWAVGKKIHFYKNLRQADMFKFAPMLRVRSIQEIEIIHSGESWRMPWVIIDGVIQESAEIEILARNDGFPSVKAFFQWFNENFTGKIIHWTNLKYT